MSSLLAVLLRNECHNLCSKCLSRHYTPPQKQWRNFHSTKGLRNEGNQEQSISRWKKMSKKKKLAYILGLGFAASGVYHTSLDEQNKRKIRVVIGGIGRFIRLVALT